MSIPLQVYFFEMRGRTRISVEIEFCGVMLVQELRQKASEPPFERPLAIVNIQNQCA